MGIVNAKYFSFGDTIPALDMANDIKAWLTRYSSTLVSAETIGDDSEAYLTCKMNNLICFRIRFTSPDAYFWFSEPYVEGETPSMYGYNRWKSSCTGTIVLSTSAIYVLFDKGGNGYRIAYVCELIGSDMYYGHRFDENNRPQYLKNIYLAKYPENSFAYHQIATFNYTCTLGLIDYTTASTISDGTNIVSDPNFYGCSAIIPFQVYTFNGDNYYALDENTLFLSNNSLE